MVGWELSMTEGRGVAFIRGAWGVLRDVFDWRRLGKKREKGAGMGGGRDGSCDENGSGNNGRKGRRRLLLPGRTSGARHGLTDLSMLGSWCSGRGW
jgi:hypothetical protein